MTVPPRIDAARGKPCPYCRRSMKGYGSQRRDVPTRDHVNPRVRGGGPTLIVCRKCNSDKADLSLREWAAVLTLRHDFRAKTVSALSADLKNGKLRVVTGGALVANPIGLAEGVFA